LVVYLMWGFYTGATDVFITGATNNSNKSYNFTNTGGTFSVSALTDIFHRWFLITQPNLIL
jgi:hypothetical protein